MSSASNGPVRICYEDTGERDRPAVICAHGFFMDRTMFAPQAAALRGQGYRVLSWDARGHGLTEADPEQPFSYWDSATDALAVMDAAGVESAVHIGMSQGGYTALRLALTAPERVRALVLLDTEASASTEAEKQGYRELFAAWCDPAVPLEPLIDGLAPRLIAGSADDQAPWRTKWAASDRRAIRAAADCLIERESVLDRLPEIDCPALVVRGQLDETSTAEKSAQLAAGLPGAGDVITIARAGHAASWTDPDPVNEAIGVFVDAIVPPVR